MKHHCATSKEKHESVGLANICTSVDLTRRLFVFPARYKKTRANRPPDHPHPNLPRKDSYHRPQHTAGEDKRSTEMAEANTCGCGRSPTGKCCGWHNLSEEQYAEKKAQWEAKQAEKKTG